MGFWIAQALSLIATVIIVISFQIKNKNILLLINGAAHILLAVSLFILGANLGALITLVATLRGFMFFKLENRPKWYVYFSFIFICALLITATALTYENWLNILQLISVLVLNFSMWQSNIILIRIVSIINGCIFTVYNALYHAYVAIALECLIIISCIIFLIRMWLEYKKFDKKTETINTDNKKETEVI